MHKLQFICVYNTSSDALGLISHNKRTATALHQQQNFLSEYFSLDDGNTFYKLANKCKICVCENVLGPSI